MHVIACGMPDVAEDSGFVGDRWLDNKRETERRQLGDIAIIPAGISHRRLLRFQSPHSMFQKHPGQDTQPMAATLSARISQN
jgi:hypothetical protein